MSEKVEAAGTEPAPGSPRDRSPRCVGLKVLQCRAKPNVLQPETGRRPADRAFSVFPRGYSSTSRVSVHDRAEEVVAGVDLYCVASVDERVDSRLRLERQLRQIGRVDGGIVIARVAYGLQEKGGLSASSESSCKWQWAVLGITRTGLRSSHGRSRSERAPQTLGGARVAEVLPCGRGHDPAEGATQQRR